MKKLFLKNILSVSILLFISILIFDSMEGDRGMLLTVTLMPMFLVILINSIIVGLALVQENKRKRILIMLLSPALIILYTIYEKSPLISVYLIWGSLTLLINLWSAFEPVNDN